MILAEDGRSRKLASDLARALAGRLGATVARRASKTNAGDFV
jgi:hypothetical protein